MEKLITAGLFGMMNSGTAYVIGAIICVLVSYLIGSVNFTRIFVNKYDAFPDTMGLYKKAGGRVAFGAAALDGLKGFLCALIYDVCADYVHLRQDGTENGKAL